MLDEEVITIVSDGSSGIDSVNNVVAVLSNENQSIPADNAGTTGTFSATTTMSVYHGAVDDSANWTYAKVDSGTASTITGATTTVTALGADIGSITVTATRSTAAQVNILSGSETFDAGQSWGFYYATVTASDIPAPNGSYTAKRITNYATNDVLVRKNNLSLAPNTYSVGMYFYVPSQANMSYWQSVIDIRDMPGAASNSSPACYVFNKWVFVEVSVIFTSTATISIAGFLDFAISFNGTTSIAANVFHIWGAMCKTGAASGKYIPYLEPVSKVFTLAKARAGTQGIIGPPGKDGFVFNPTINADFAGAILPTGFTYPGTIASSDYGTTTRITNFVVDQSLIVTGAKFPLVPADNYDHH